MSFVSGQCRNRPKGEVQAPPAWGGLAAGAALSLLSACSSGPSYNPVDWWHSLEGGPLDAARPPPPNADAPYPSLGSVPAKPPALDKTAGAALSGGLVADRANAKYAATLAPIRPFQAGAAARPPALAAQAGADDQTMGAKMGAATAPIRPLGPPQPPLPPVVVTPPKRAPVTGVSSAPLAPPPPAPAPAPAPASAAASAVAPAPPAPAAASAAASAAAPAPPAPATASASAAADATLPPVPDAPPPPVAIAGVDLPRTAPTPPPVAPKPAVAPPAPPKPGDPVTVAFQPGSAVLPTDAANALKSLAARRAGLPIAVIGYGDATSDRAADQSAALPLAVDRSRAIAAALESAGVAVNDLRVDAQAQGAGGGARILAP